MDNINELTSKANPYADNQSRRMPVFLNEINADIRVIQELIKRYNDSRDGILQQTLLHEIEINYQAIFDKYPANLMAYSADFKTEIEDKLFNALQAEREKLNVSSAHPDDSLSRIIESMPGEKVARLMTILNDGAQFNPDDFYDLYTNADLEEDYDRFQSFLNHITEIKFLGGVNSKNFQITYPNGDSQVLKLEYRFGQPAIIETHINNHLPTGVLSPTHVKRQATFTYRDEITARRGIKAVYRAVNRSLLLTDFCQGGDLKYHGEQIKNPSQKIESALDIYIQMASILTRLTQSQCAFPDMKNTNWLIDDKGLIKIADTKSFLHIDEHGQLDLSIPQNKWSILITTEVLNPPELLAFNRNTLLSADKMHVYMLGKNLFQYLTGCDYTDLEKTTLPFNKHSIFQTDEGKDLQKLIKYMIEVIPNQRITTDLALIGLQGMQKHRVEKEKALREDALMVTLDLKKETCLALLKKIRAHHFGSKDIKMYEFYRRTEQEINKFRDIRHQPNIDELETISQRLKSMLEPENLAGITKLKQYLTDFRKSAAYYLDFNNKYRQIKNAILAIPVEERACIHQQGTGRSAEMTKLDGLLTKYCEASWLDSFYQTTGTNALHPASSRFKARLSSAAQDSSLSQPLPKK